MAIILDPDAARAGWQHGATARAEVVDAISRTGEAAGHDMADLAATLGDAARDLEGVLRVVLGVVDEHHSGVEACIADFLATDGTSAGEFHGLSR